MNHPKYRQLASIKSVGDNMSSKVHPWTPPYPPILGSYHPLTHRPPGPGPGPPPAPAYQYLPTPWPPHLHHLTYPPLDLHHTTPIPTPWAPPPLHPLNHQPSGPLPPLHLILTHPLDPTTPVPHSLSPARPPPPPGPPPLVQFCVQFWSLLNGQQDHLVLSNSIRYAIKRVRIFTNWPSTLDCHTMDKILVLRHHSLLVAGSSFFTMLR